jgi:hypothetical protein
MYFHSCYMYRLSRHHLTDFIIMQSSPASCHSIPLMYRYSPQYHVLKYPQSYVLPMTRGTKFHTLIFQYTND